MLVIPSLFKGLFPSQGSKEERETFFRDLEAWRSNPFTEELSKALKAELEAAVQKDEEESGFLSFFDFRFKRAKALGYRCSTRKILKHLIKE